MVERKWLLAVLALAALVGMSGTASAQFSCPVPVGEGLFQFGGQSLIDAAGTPNPDTNLLFDGLLGVWPGIFEGYDDFDSDNTEAFNEARDDVPFAAEAFLITAIASNPDLEIQGQSVDVYNVVCAEWVETLNLIDRVAFSGDLFLFDTAVANSVVKLTALDIMFADDETDYDSRVETGLTSDTNPNAANFPQQSEFSFNANVAALLPDGGDLDNDGITNLAEWQAAFDNHNSLGSSTVEDFIAAINEYVATMLAGSAVTITISGPSEAFTDRVSDSYSAVTAYPEEYEGDADTTYAWASSDTGVFTVNTATGSSTTVTGVAAGTANLTATGDGSEATGSLSVSVRVPEWFEVCDLGTLFAGQGEALAGSLGCDLVNTPFFDDDRFDAEFDVIGFTGIVGDGARDAFQVQLLAYTMCALGGEEDAPQFLPGGAKANNFVGDANDVVADYLANFADLEDFVNNTNLLADWLVSDTEEVSISGGGTITLDIATTTTLTASSTDAADVAFVFTETAPGLGYPGDPLGVISLSGATATQVTVTGSAPGNAYVFAISGTTGIVATKKITVRATTPDPGPDPGPGPELDDCGNEITKSNFTNLEEDDHTVLGDVPIFTGEAATDGLVKDLQTLQDNKAGAVTDIEAFIDAPTAGAVEGAIDALSDPSVLALLMTLAGDDGLGFLADNIGTVAHVTAALGGLSTEYSVTTNLLLDGQALASTDIPGLFEPGGDLFLLVAGILHPSPGTGLKATVDSIVAGIEAVAMAPIAAVSPDIAALQADVDVLAATAARLNSGNPGDPDDFTVPTWRIYGQGSKLPNEPFSGSGDWDGDGTTNAQISQFVSGANGDFIDFVNGAAGLSPFFAGNPGLPAVGFLGLGLLAGAMATGGALVVRRRK